MGNREESDPLDSLFADALKAVEKVTEKKPEDQEDPAPEMEFEIEFIDEGETDSNNDVDDFEIPIDFDEEPEDNEAGAELEMLLLAKEEEIQHLQTNLKKALRGVKRKKKDNEAMTLRMELLQKLV